MTDSPGVVAERPARRVHTQSIPLLVDIAAQALDPAYREAAARGPRRHRSPAPRAGYALAGAVAVALVLVAAGVQAHRQAPAAARARQALVGQVHAAAGGVAALEHRLDALRATTSRLRDSLLETSAAGAARAHRLSTLELAAGTVPVTGPGLRVLLDDAADQPANRVTDRDLQAVVNALWAAGAEAVAVDGQRLTAQSAIRQAGSAILANFSPLTRPYEVSAIGDPVTLATRFGAGAVADRMRVLAQAFGLRFDYHRASRLDLPATPTLPVRYARPAAGGAGA